MFSFKKILSSLFILLSLFLLSSSLVKVSAASITSGPAGANGLRAYPGPGKGEITLEWSRVSLNGENYSVLYGLTPDAASYIADHVGYVATYTVGNLQPGKTYYFKLNRFWTGNVNMGSDGVVKAVAPASAVTVMGTAGPIGRNLLKAQTGAKTGQVLLTWKRFFPDTEKYNIVYGTKPGTYSYGVLNAVDTTPQDNDYNYMVGGLKAGTRYYFALIPQRNGQGIYTTSEVSFVAR